MTNSSSKFNMVVASLHHPIYGFDIEESSPDIRNHFLCIHRSPNTTPKERKLARKISQVMRDRIRILNKIGSDIWPKEVGTRNFYNIMEYLEQPQIGETIMLPGDEMVVILKTIWIRLLQRKWKNICMRRKEILQKRCHAKAIQERERSGKWPYDCQELPGLRGMMAELTTC